MEHTKENVTDLNPVIKIRSSKLRLPAKIDLAHLTPGDSVGFDSILDIDYTSGVVGTVAIADGFAPLKDDGQSNRFQTATGGRCDPVSAREAR